jgi:hypothetical protein
VRATGFSAAAAFVTIAMSCFTVSAQAAEGLEPGVHADPGSPAAKEYALPINQARQTGAASGHAAGSPALFGAGIKPPGSGGSGQARSNAESRSNAENTTHGVRHDASRVLPTHPRTPLPAAVLRAERSPASSSDSSLLALLGGGVAILVLGAFGGTIMKRGNRSSDSFT